MSHKDNFYPKKDQQNQSAEEKSEPNTEEIYSQQF